MRQLLVPLQLGDVTGPSFKRGGCWSLFLGRDVTSHNFRDGGYWLVEKVITVTLYIGNVCRHIYFILFYIFYSFVLCSLSLRSLFYSASASELHS